MNFKEKQAYFVGIIEGNLAKSITIENPYYPKLKEAMQYSLMAGGKRLRPVLALATAEMFGKELHEVLAYACSIEMIHTYSLIHDDLPAMDNDDYRRGKLTNHKVFGEAMAILAGDALLNMAYENMLKDALASDNSRKLRAMSIIAEYAGALGMIGGQVIDLDSEGKSVDSDKLKAMHSLKTGALIKAPIESAAIICGADAKELKLLSSYATNLGLAFQIKDDILDVEGSIEDMGKSPGSDALCEKSTYVTMYGLDKSKKLLEAVTNEGMSFLERFDTKAEFLKELAVSLVLRLN
ncbi:MAG: polyprenyl synthetase family protein [Ruminiclostridium sp.]